MLAFIMQALKTDWRSKFIKITSDINALYHGPISLEVTILSCGHCPSRVFLTVGFLALLGGVMCDMSRLKCGTT